MAFTKEHKAKMITQYEQWLSKSQAIFMLEFSKMTMKEVDAIRAKARESGAEMHVVKNTLFSAALDKMGMEGKNMLEQTTLVGFAFGEAPALAKLVNDSTKGDIFKVKGGVLGKSAMTPEQVKALASLPPLPIVRAQFLGLLTTPASRLVRTIAEPARGLASVVRAHSEQSTGDSAETEAAPVEG